jgi:hypothetical protein
MGGVNLRLLASERPDDVAGMVLVDAMGDEVPLRYWALVPEAPLSEFRRGVSKLPEGIDFETLVAGIDEMHRSSRTLGDKPLVVITRGIEDSAPWASTELTAKLLVAWQETQVPLSRLSNNSVQVVARNSRHVIQKDEPRLVSAAIRNVVEAARAGASLDASRLSAVSQAD